MDSTRVNTFDSPRTQAEADHQTKVMYNASSIFIAGGSAEFIGNPALKLLACIYLDGLGRLWSCNYIVVKATHRMSNNGYRTSTVVWTNSIFGTQNDKEAAKTAAQANIQKTPDALFNIDETKDPLRVDYPVGK